MLCLTHFNYIYSLCHDSRVVTDVKCTCVIIIAHAFMLSVISYNALMYILYGSLYIHVLYTVFFL